MLKKIQFIAAALAVFFAMPVSAHAITCSKARLAVEHTICSSGKLMKMDTQMNSMYRFAKRKISASNRKILNKSQRNWLKNRNKCRTNAKCVVASYKIWFKSFEKHKHKFQ